MIVVLFFKPNFCVCAAMRNVRSQAVQSTGAHRIYLQLVFSGFLTVGRGSSQQQWVAVFCSHQTCLSFKILLSETHLRTRKNFCNNGITTTASVKFFRSIRRNKLNILENWSHLLLRCVAIGVQMKLISKYY